MLEVDTGEPGSEVEALRLDNGLRVVLRRDATLPLVAVNLTYTVGSRHDPTGLSGLAHLLEHLFYQGSENVPGQDYMRHVRRVGGHANAKTSLDRTAVHLVVPSHFLELALWLESDRMGRLLPALGQRSLDTQRLVVLNERRQKVEGGPFGRATELVHELLFAQGHPYRRPVIGTPEDLQRIELGDVEAFFQANYGPSRGILTIAGDFPPAEAKDWAERYFGDLPPARSALPPEAVASDGPLAAEKRLEIEGRVPVARVYHAFRLPPYGTRAWYAASLLAHALAGGRTGNLKEELVDRESMALGVECKTPVTQLASSFWLMAAGRPGTPAEQLDRRLGDGLASLAERPLAERQIEKAKNWLVSHLCHENQLLAEMADRLSQSTALLGEPQTLQAEVESYRSLSARDLQEVAAEFLSVSRRAALTISPSQAH